MAKRSSAGTRGIWGLRATPLGWDAMTRLDAIRARVASEDSWDELENFLAERLKPVKDAKWSECMQAIDDYARTKDVAWLVKTVDLLRRAMQSAPSRTSWIDHLRAKARLEEPDATT